MEQKKSKYDTNPLDPDVARRTDDVWGATRATGDARNVSETEEMQDATRNIATAPQPQPRASLDTEAPTRRYDSKPKAYTSYPSVFVPPAYEPPSAQGAASGISSGAAAAHAEPFTQPPTSRHIKNVNMPENVVLMLPYIPFPFIGAAVAAILLFLIPREEPRARFHASQGLALHMIVLAVSFLTGMVDNFLSGPPAVILSIASAAFSVLAFIFFVVSMIRVYKGDPHVVAPLGELTRLLNEKIEPRK